MVAQAEHGHVEPRRVLVPDVIEPGELRPEGGGDVGPGPGGVISHDHEHGMPESLGAWV